MKASLLSLVGAAVLGLAGPAFADQMLAIPGRTDFTFDSSGILYVTAGSDIVRYDTNAGGYLPTFPVGGSLVGIDLSPDGGTLAVADSTTQDGKDRIVLVDSGTGATTEKSFPLDFSEAGTYMVAWGADGRLLVTSRFAGSGWVPLRLYDPGTDTVTTLRTVRQDTMLTASADRSTIGLAESNISSGPVSAYDAGSGDVVGTVNTNWFTYEVAVSAVGDQFVVPTYNGAYVYDRAGSTFTLRTTLGQYATYGPVGAVYSPVAPYLFTAEYDNAGARSGVKVYDTSTFTQVASLDAYRFPWSGNHALGQGRMKISPDGGTLAVSVDGGIRVYDVSAFTAAAPGPVRAAAGMARAAVSLEPRVASSKARALRLAPPTPRRPSPGRADAAGSSRLRGRRAR